MRIIPEKEDELVVKNITTCLNFVRSLGVKRKIGKTGLYILLKITSPYLQSLIQLFVTSRDTRRYPGKNNSKYDNTVRICTLIYF